MCYNGIVQRNKEIENMKTKLEKVMELTPITMGINEERDSKIAKRWSHKGLDFLLEMWHKYYNR